MGCEALPRSAQVATKLEKLGYCDVRKYADGIEDWSGAGLPTGSARSAAPQR